MLKSESDQAQLFHLIFEGKPLVAMAYLNNHQLQGPIAQKDYFFKFYQNSLYKPAFFEFWKTVLHSNFDTPPLSINLKSFVEKCCSNAIHLKDEALIRECLSNPKIRDFTLQELVAYDQNNDFTLSLLANPSLSHLFPPLFTLSIQYYNADLTKRLLKINLPLPPLTDEEHRILHDLNILEPHKAHFMHEQMRHFAKGFGHIKHSDILLTLAQIQSRKDYIFQPLAVSEKKLDDFFEYLNSKPHPLTQKFIVSGEHCYCGEIAIDSDHYASVYLIDSMGLSLESSSFHEDFIQKMLEHFNVRHVYINQEVRQFARKGCSIFAIDDIQHLYRLRLPREYQDIWDYLQKTACQDPHVLEDIDILIEKFPLPAPLLRTMQTRALLATVIPERLKVEPEYPINEKGETIFQSSQKLFQAKEDGTPVNMRLMYKLNKMKLNNWTFLKTCTPAELDALKSQFTMQGHSSPRARAKDI